MAKRKKEPAVLRTFNSSKDDKSLLLADTFIYEVEIWKYSERGVNLEDSRTISSKTHTVDAHVYFKKDGISYRRETTLIAAPLEWLTENKYTELCQDSQKTQ